MGGKTASIIGFRAISMLNFLNQMFSKLHQMISLVGG